MQLANTKINLYIHQGIIAIFTYFPALESVCCEVESVVESGSHSSLSALPDSNSSLVASILHSCWLSFSKVLLLSVKNCNYNPYLQFNAGQCNVC